MSKSSRLEKERREARQLWDMIKASGRKEFRITTLGHSRDKVFWIDTTHNERDDRKRDSTASVTKTLYRSEYGTIPVNIERSVVLLRKLAAML